MPIIILIIFLIFPQHTAPAAKGALIMCASSVIPSLFPLMAASKMIMTGGVFSENNPIFTILARLFRISACGVWAFLLGLFCGYPIGGKTALDLYRAGRISKKETLKLICFCNNGGPAFIIAVVGGMFFEDYHVGFIIYLSHIFAGILLGLILRVFHTSPIDTAIEKNEKTGAAAALTEAIRDSAVSMLTVVGVIVFFAALYSCLDALLITSLLPNDMAKGMFMGIFEITSGIKMISAVNAPLIAKYTVASFLLSFSGISIFCQVLAFANGLNIKITPCVIAKVLSAGISAGLTFIAFSLTANHMLLAFIGASISIFLITLSVKNTNKQIKVYNKPNPNYIWNHKNSGKRI